MHDVDGVGPALYDGDRPVVVDAGFEVAPGDASDVEVANAHAWGSDCLIFSDGTWARTAPWIAQHASYRGIAHHPCSCTEILFYNPVMISGKKNGSHNLQVDEAGRVSVRSPSFRSVDDVLLRKRA